MHDKERALLRQLEAITADATIPRSRRREWIKVFTAATEIATGEPPTRGRPRSVNKDQIRLLIAAGRTNVEIAAEVGCSANYVSHVRCGRR